MQAVTLLESVIAMMKLLNLPRQYRSIKPEIDQAIQSVLDSGQFIGGLSVERFEKEWADYVGVKHCVGVGSGTDALRIALEAAGIGGDVIVPANTAFPTAEAVVQAGCIPVFCDCDPGTYTMSPEHLSSLISSKTEAIIPVHLYGHPCEMDAIMGIADRHGLFLLEDCAHAHGAQYKGKSVGSFGHIGAFSFNPTKVLGAHGDAGGLVSDNELLIDRCRTIANHGRIDKNTHQVIGLNSRLDALQAAVLSVKLKYLDEWLDNRLGNVLRYRMYPGGNLDFLVTMPGRGTGIYLHSYHQFVIRLPERDKIRQALATVYDIETGVHYPKVLQEQPALQYFGARPEDTPTAYQYSREILSLPINESMRFGEVDAVCDALIEVVNNG